jgi:hypothetical protein
MLKGGLVRILLLAMAAGVSQAQIPTGSLNGHRSPHALSFRSMSLNSCLAQTTRPASLDGCPMFALAYMGRERRGAAQGEAPSNASALRAKGFWCEQEPSCME